MPASGYRIWIKKARQMCPVTDIRWDHAGTHPFLSAAFLFTRPNGPETHAACSYRDGVLMAATGIPDRYGAEIYEGDILNVRRRVGRAGRRHAGYAAKERLCLRLPRARR